MLSPSARGRCKRPAKFGGWSETFLRVADPKVAGGDGGAVRRVFQSGVAVAIAALATAAPPSTFAVFHPFEEHGRVQTRFGLLTLLVMPSA